MVHTKLTVTVLCNCGHAITVMKPVSRADLDAIKSGSCPECTHPELFRLLSPQIRSVMSVAHPKQR